MILQNCRPLQGANYFWGSRGALPIHLGSARVILEVLSDFSLKGREISWIVESLPYWECSCGFSCEIMCFTHVSTCVCVCVHTCIHLSVYVCAHAPKHAHMWCVCMCVLCAHKACAYAVMCVHLSTYIHVHTCATCVLPTHTHIQSTIKSLQKWLSRGNLE